MKKELWGTIKDKEIYLYTIQNHNLQVSITNYGATLVAIRTIDGNLQYRDILLGYDTLCDYQSGKSYFGGLVGRNANRIEGDIVIDGKTYSLSKNEGNNHHHSAEHCTAHKVWDVIETQCSKRRLVLTINDSEAAGSLPGNVQLTACYELLEDNSLSLTVSGRSDQKTLINVTSHGYFQLDGHGSGDILGQYLKINALEYNPINKCSLPTGERQSVKNTPFDFTDYRMIGEQMDMTHEQLILGNGYDHNFILAPSDSPDDMRLAAQAYSKESRIQMDVYTNCPCIQFYTGNYIPEHTGKNKSTYNKQHGFCIEPQYIPNAIHLQGYDIPYVEANEEKVFRMKLHFSVI